MNRSLRILLVEDNPGDADLIKEMLNEAGVRFDMKCVERLSSAREQIHSDSFDIILLDLGLPDSQGLVSLMELNEIRPDVPIIVLTGLVDESVGFQTVQEGAQDYLIKGQIDKNILARSINYAIERKKAEGALLKSEAALKEAQRVGHIGSWDWDTVTDTITWSSEYYRIINLDPKVPPPDYRNHLNIYTVESAERLDAAVKKAMQTGEPYELDLEITEPTGAARWICSRGEARRNDGGRIVGLRGTTQDITERKRAEAELKEEKAFIENALNIIRDVFFVIGLEGKFLRWNKTLNDITGYSDCEITSMKPQDFFRSDDIERVSKAIKSTVQKGSAGIEATVVTKVGRQIPYEIEATLMRDDEGSPIGICGVGRDITERQQIEKERETLLRWKEGVNLLGRSLLAPATQDQKLKSITDGIVRLFDVDFCRIWLIRPGDLCEEGCIHAQVQEGPHVCRYRDRCLHLLSSSGRYTQTDRSEHHRVPFGCYKIGQIATGEEHKFLTNDVQNDPRIHDHEWARDLGLVSFAGYQLHVPDGQTIGVLALFAKHPISADEDAMLDGISSTTAQVIQQTAAETALKKSEAFNRNILDTVDEGFIMVDRQYLIQSANKAFCSFVNLPEGQVLGRPCYEVLHHCNKPCYEAGEDCAIKRTFETGAPHAVSHTHFSDNGTKHHVEIKSYPVTDASGNVVSAIETINDVTEKIKLEDQLRHAQKMESIGTLAGGIAHDFNNILNVILGYGSMMLNRLGDDQLSREQLNEMLAAADRAANLTKRLLAFSRKQVVDMKPVNGNEIIIGLEKMLSRIIGEDIVFALELVGIEMIVMADTGQIEQVLMNLATNARDAMPKGGRLTIGTGLAEVDDKYVAAYGYGKPGKYFLITISDTGHGIEAETQKKIFEPFFTTKGIGEGTGLGLAISYGIIKQHNGYIMACSEPGQGTIFKIYLPLIEDTAILDKQADAPVTFKGGNESILLAEDDVSIRELLKIILESFGYSVITAVDGEDTIAKFMENRDKIQLAIIDMIMPKKNGKEVSDVIWKVNPLTKILFMSGYAMDTIKTHEVVESGSGFIQKPIMPQDFLKKVRKVLDR